MISNPKFNTFVSSKEDIKRCLEHSELFEVLIEPKITACQGKLSLKDSAQLAVFARQHELRPVLVWDSLQTESVISQQILALKDFQFDLFEAVRVQDLGVSDFLFESFPALPQQLLFEGNNANFKALSSWEYFFSHTQGVNLDRLVLSRELTETELCNYVKQLKCHCEVLGVGPILLFYSPRELLTTSFTTGASISDQGSELLCAEVSSAESGNRSFPTVQSIHGTMTFLDKDNFILDRLSKLLEAGIYNFRLDLRHISEDKQSASAITQVIQGFAEDPQKLRKEWPRKTRAPFFKTNKTTAQFSRLKAGFHQLKDSRAGAEVLSGEKGRYYLLRALRDFHSDESESFILSQGEEVSLQGKSLVFKNLDQKIIDECREGEIFLIPWQKNLRQGAFLRLRS